MIKMIAAVAQNGVIGQDNKLPFNYPEDMKFFRKMTANSTVIMGRKTWESIGRLLPKRRNIVISRNKVDVAGLETFSSIQDAVESTKQLCCPEGVKYQNETNAFAGDHPGDCNHVWLIGGSSIYREGMRFADEIYLTLLPDTIVGDNLAFFPWINPAKFQVAEYINLEDSPLKVAKYIRV